MIYSYCQEISLDDIYLIWDKYHRTSTSTFTFGDYIEHIKHVFFVRIL